MTENEFTEAWTESISAALRMALAEAGMTRAELARLSGIHENNLGRYFKGQRPVPVTVLFEIAPHMNTSPGEIVTQAQNVLEKRTSMSWGEHVLAAKRGHLDPPEQ